MRNRLFALGLCLAVALALATPAALAQKTQTRGDWPVVQALSPGEKIVVRTKDGDRFTGRFDNASDILLVFEDDGRKVSLARDSIRLVQLNRGKSRLKGILVGAAIGGGIWLRLAARSTSQTATRSSPRRARFDPSARIGMARASARVRQGQQERDHLRSALKAVNRES